MRHPRLCRRGVTLVEVMVAVAIIGLLAAIIAPAVLAARGASRRIDCANRMRQIGIAFQNYHTTYNCLPHLGYDIGRVTWSVWRSLLPDLELQSLEQRAREVDLDFADDGQASNATFERALQIPILQCPADGSMGIYGANFGINWGGGSQTAPDGAFTADKRLTVGFNSMTDGTSNTAMVSEFLRGDTAAPGYSEAARADGRRLVFNVVPGIDNAADMPGMFDRCRSMDPKTSPVLESDRGRLWLSGGYDHYSYNHFDLPNRYSCVNSGNAWGLILSSSSLHGSGVNVLFADGSVRFINDQLDLKVWRAFGTRAGAERVEQ